MMTKRCILVVVLFACVGMQVEAASNDRTGYYKIMDRFFELLGEQKPGEAIDSIYASSPYLDKITDQVAHLKVQFVASNESTFGKYHTRDILIDKEIAGRYAYVYVFVAYDRQPLKMEFHFYRPQEKWVLQKFSYSADVDDDIATFAKYDLMK